MRAALVFLAELFAKASDRPGCRACDSSVSEGITSKSGTEQLTYIREGTNLQTLQHASKITSYATAHDLVQGNALLKQKRCGWSDMLFANARTCLSMTEEEGKLIFTCRN